MAKGSSVLAAEPQSVEVLVNTGAPWPSLF
jgi:hypothetical protein